MMDAVLWQDQIPVYGGARALSDKGMASSLMPANRRDAPVAGLDDALLYDPQTAGGLLAALPPDAAAKAVAQMEAQGITAAVIGRLSSGQGAITLEQRR